MIHVPFWPLNTTLFAKEIKARNVCWLFYHLKSVDFAGQNGAGAVPGVNRNALHLIPCAIPPDALQEKFGAFANPVHKQLVALERSTTTLRRTRDMLLPKLISGEIEVDAAGPG
ncbi:MAG TPA: hypothetical protein PKA58_31975 [Polyangium sp.]|nr:hypothetical protein [Polyangium sp.]